MVAGQELADPRVLCQGERALFVTLLLQSGDGHFGGGR